MGSTPPQSIGPFTILGEAGHGGFGTVYRAEQTHPVRRQVALKVLKTGMASESGLQRFQSEQQALAALHHPNIAAIFQSGSTAEGLPYFAMEWVEGTALTEYCDQRQLSARRRLELFLDLCRAVQHAHQKGIIHRDLKPGNVLVSEDEGNQPRLLVIDFGIAKSLQSGLDAVEPTLNLETRLGTPEYMSPEQSRGDLDIDTRSDVYSLGVMLYELLTGTTPLRGAGDESSSSALETLHRIELTEPPKPSIRLRTLGDKITGIAQSRATEPGTLRRTVRGELDWIVMKALEKDRGRRYDSASALAADVRNFLHGDPVSAGAPTAFYITRKLIARHRAFFAAASACLLLLAVGAVFCVAMGRRSEAAAIRTEAARKVVDQESNLRLRALDQAEGILSSLVGDTGAALDSRGRAGVFREVAERAQTYFAGHPAPKELSEVRAASLASVERARLLAARNGGNAEDALRMPGIEKWPVLRAALLAETGRREKATRAYEALSDADASEAMRDLRLGLLTAGDPAAARERLEEIGAELDETVPDLQKRLLANSKAAGWRELLAEVFAARGRLTTREAGAFYEWEQAAEDFENAADQCERIVALDPTNLRLGRRQAGWLLDAAEAWLRAGRPDQSAETLRRISSDPTNSRSWELRARIDLELRRIDDAFIAVNRALELQGHERSAQLLVLIGKIESARGNTEQAADALLQAREVWLGQPPRLPAETAAILAAAGRAEDAIAWLREAVTRLSSDESGNLLAIAATHDAQARLLEARGETTEAMAQWRSAIEALERQTGAEHVSLIEREASSEVAELAFRIRRRLQSPGEAPAAPSPGPTNSPPSDPARADVDYTKAVSLSNEGEKNIGARLYPEAEVRLGEAVARLEQLVASESSPPAIWRNELAVALTRSARLRRLVRPARMEEALAFNHRAIRERSSLYENTKHPKVLSELTRDYIEMALSYVAGGQFGDAEGVLADRLQVLEAELNSQPPPGNAVVIDSIGHCHFSLATIRNLRGDGEGALRALAQATAARGELHRRAPNKAIWAAALVESLSAAAGLADRLGHFGQAEFAYAEAVELEGQLADWRKKQWEKAPESADARKALADDGGDYVKILWSRARRCELLESLSNARGAYEECLEWSRVLAEAGSSERGDLFRARSLVGLGGVRLADGDYAGSRAALEEAKAISAADSAPLLIDLQSKLGECLFQLGETDEARALLTDAVRVAESEPKPAGEMRYYLTRARLSLAQLFLETNETEAAGTLLSQAREPWAEPAGRDALWKSAADTLLAKADNQLAVSDMSAQKGR